MFRCVDGLRRIYCILFCRCRGEFILIVGFLLGTGGEIDRRGTFGGRFTVLGHGNNSIDALGVWYCDSVFGVKYGCFGQDLTIYCTIHAIKQVATIEFRN